MMILRIAFLTRCSVPFPLIIGTAATGEREKDLADKLNNNHTPVSMTFCIDAQELCWSPVWLPAYLSCSN